MTTYDYDLVVLGAGSAGVRASRVAAGLSARVAVCEERDLGGTCVNVGCVPKKLLVYGAHFAEEVEDARAYGWTVEAPRHDWAHLIARKDEEIARLNGVYQRLLEGRGVEIVRGRGVLTDPHTIEVTAADGAQRTLTARYVLVATGGAPRRPSFPGAENVLVSDDVFRLSAMPRRIVILGGGYIAVEMAGIFHGYGADVTLVHRGSALLRGFDADVRRHLAEELQKKGIKLIFGVDAQHAARTESGVALTLADATVLEADAVLAAIGRDARHRDLGLEQLGVETDAHGILVDEDLRTSVANIYAAGDVIARVALTPVALAEGQMVARQLFGGEPVRVAYGQVPSAVFSTPSVGTVGLTEAEARYECADVDVYRTTFTPMKHTMTRRPERTLMKMLVDRATDRVLGVHVVGPDAGEIIQGFAVALRMGATKKALDGTSGIHPTAAEELVTMREPAAPPHPSETSPPRAFARRVWPT